MPPFGLRAGQPDPFTPEGETEDFGFPGVLGTGEEQDPRVAALSSVMAEYQQIPEQQERLGQLDSLLANETAKLEEINRIRTNKSKLSRRLDKIFFGVDVETQDQVLRAKLAQPVVGNIVNLMQERRLLEQPTPLQAEAMKHVFEMFDQQVAGAGRQKLLGQIMQDPTAARAINPIMAQAYLAGETKFENILKDDEDIKRDEAAQKGYDLGADLSKMDPAAQEQFLGLASKILGPLEIGMARTAADSLRTAAKVKEGQEKADKGKPIRTSKDLPGEYETPMELFNAFDAARFLEFVAKGRLARQRESTGLSYGMAREGISESDTDRTRGDIATHKQEWIDAGVAVFKQRFDLGGNAGAILLERLDPGLKAAIMGQTVTSDVISVGDEALEMLRQRAGTQDPATAR